MLGQFMHTVDSKNRMFVPAKFREELGEKFMLFKSIRDKYIKMMSLSEWEEYIAPMRKDLDRKDLEKVFRYLNRTAVEVTPDSQGRIVIPQALIDHARIVKNAVVIGCGDYAEIWSEEEDLIANEAFDEDVMRAELEAYGL